MVLVRPNGALYIAGGGRQGQRWSAEFHPLANAKWAREEAALNVFQDSEDSFRENGRKVNITGLIGMPTGIIPQRNARRRLSPWIKLAGAAPWMSKKWAVLSGEGGRGSQLAREIPIVKTVWYVHWYTVHSSASLTTTSFISTGCL